MSDSFSKIKNSRLKVLGDDYSDLFSDDELAESGAVPAKEIAPALTLEPILEPILESKQETLTIPDDDLEEEESEYKESPEDAFLLAEEEPEKERRHRKPIKFETRDVSVPFEKEVPVLPTKVIDTTLQSTRYSTRPLTEDEIQALIPKKLGHNKGKSKFQGLEVTNKKGFGLWKCGNCKHHKQHWRNMAFGGRNVTCEKMGVPEDALPCSWREDVNNKFVPISLGDVALAKDLERDEVMMLKYLLDHREKEIVAEKRTGFKVDQSVKFVYQEAFCIGTIISLQKSKAKVRFKTKTNKIKEIELVVEQLIKI